MLRHTFPALKLNIFRLRSDYYKHNAVEPFSTINYNNTNTILSCKLIQSKKCAGIETCNNINILII